MVGSLDIVHSHPMKMFSSMMVPLTLTLESACSVKKNLPVFYTTLMVSTDFIQE